ncbi:MAG: UDP-N-acetylmuramate dehydrogenase [Anaerolineae bacterium]|nr:UDP-N-acetylmuramate dehydrogenase [Anaerolineae bacterium]
MNEYEAVLRPIVGDALHLDAPMARYTVARLGGAADALVIADSVALLEQTARTAWSHGWQVRIIGDGANVLVADRGVRGVVIINRADKVTFEESGVLVAESGAALISLARACLERRWAGLTWAIGIPGTLGGAVVNNAGAYSGAIADCLLWAEIAEPDQPTRRWENAELAYAYRESALKRRSAPFAVLRAALQLQPNADPAALRAEAEQYSAHRRRTQPNGASLGSMFKNPPNDYAGRLIEAAGLKGTQIGGVVISPQHANWFINTGNGTAADYLALIRLAQERVAELFGVQLELEVELIGDF